METETFDRDEMASGQAVIWRYMLGFVDSMALKCAVELRIADIMHSHGCPITLHQIASSIGSPSPDIPCLERIMRLLVHREIFTSDPGSNGAGTLYGLNHSSKWLLHDGELTMAPMLLMENDERALAPWHHLSRCAREGGLAFEKAHGCDVWEYTSCNPNFNKLFSDGMKCMAEFTLRPIIAGHRDLFDHVGSLVDVGGGTGAAVAEIVRAHPHIKGINYDLPHVIEMAQEYNGVSHIAGDMFEMIPDADAVFMKSVLHDWGDEDCMKILQNCRKAIPVKTGKIIIAEIVLDPKDDIGLVFDLVMMAHSSGGRERTEVEWDKLLRAVGFPRYNIIKGRDLISIIEVYLE